MLAAVSEKTGYPSDVLDLDLDLEADLGIDTVKQAELFAAIRGQYGIARREDLRLSDYNTLAKVIKFVEESNQCGSCTDGRFSTSYGRGSRARWPPCNLLQQRLLHRSRSHLNQ